MASLLILPNLSDSAQPVQQITAASANWQYVGFEVHDLVAGDQVSGGYRSDSCGIFNL
jgi:5-deoxy-D-glucuronate isomerase